MVFVVFFLAIEPRLPLKMESGSDYARNLLDVSDQGRATGAATQERRSTAQAQSPETRAEAANQSQAARQEARASAQVTRQQYGASAQASRPQVYEDEHWDEGKGLAIAATGALAAATSAATAPRRRLPGPRRS